jgi:hypothetical protein
MQDVDQIHRLAKLGGVKGTQADTQAKSGVALKVEQQQLFAALSEKADNIEQAEWDILTIWAMWQDKDFDGLIDYPDDFDYDNLSADLDNAIKSQTIRINSKTFEKERAKSVVDGLIPKLDEEKRQTIFKEIDEGGLTDTDTLKEKFEVGE